MATQYLAGGNGTDTIAMGTYDSGTTTWTWTTAGTSPFTPNSCFALKWNPTGNYWLAGGNGTDTIVKGTYNSVTTAWTWTAAGTSPFLGNICWALAWNPTGNYWLAGGNGTMVKKTNIAMGKYTGTSWTWTDTVSTSLFSGNVCYALEWNPTGNYWLAGGRGTSTIAMGTYDSGTTSWTWTAAGSASLFSGNFCNTLEWNLTGNYWLAGGYDGTSPIKMGRYNTLTTAWNWTAAGATPFLGNDCRALEWNPTGNYWLAGGDGTNTIAMGTYDGTSWTWTAAGTNPFSGNYCFVLALIPQLLPPPQPSICFLRDTPILTLNGKYVNIQDLNIGDSIHTPISAKDQKIKRIVSNTHNYSHIHQYNVPYRIPKGFFNTSTPTQDVFISGFHALIFTNTTNEVILVDANQHPKFSPVPISELKELGFINSKNEINYYNIELETVDGMFAGGVPVETMGLKDLYLLN